MKKTFILILATLVLLLGVPTFSFASETSLTFKATGRYMQDGKLMGIVNGMTILNAVDADGNKFLVLGPPAFVGNTYNGIGTFVDNFQFPDSDNTFITLNHVLKLSKATRTAETILTFTVTGKYMQQDGKLMSVINGMTILNALDTAGNEFLVLGPLAFVGNTYNGIGTFVDNFQFPDSDNTFITLNHVLKLSKATRVNSTETQQTTPTPQPTTPTPPPVTTTPAGLWSTIETPQAWAYNPTYPTQSGKIGTTYDVGPNQQFTRLTQVPWLYLMPGDTVRIHWQPQPYNEIIPLSNRGTSSDYIRITGVPGPNGELPVLDGNGATEDPTNTALGNPYLAGLGLIIVTPPKGSTWGYKPGYIEISNLEIRNAHQDYTYTKQDGSNAKWNVFASGIYIERGEHIAIINNNIHDNGNGIFQNSKYDEAAQSRDLLIDGNYLHDNGVVGDAHVHNCYTEGVGTVYQNNYMGPIKQGALGDNVKERSVGIIFRYNYIEGGVCNVEFLDPESNANYESVQKDAWGNLLANASYMYGNTLVLRDGSNGWKNPWEKILLTFGGGPDKIRSGKLYFYNNTVISQYDYNPYDKKDVTLFNMLNNNGSSVVYARNNVFYATSATPGQKAAPFSMFYSYGNADFSNNWISEGWVPIDQKVHNSANPYVLEPFWDGSGLGTLMSNSQNDPGFVNIQQDDYHLTATSPLINAGTNTFDSEIIKTNQLPVFEKDRASGTIQRKQDGQIDIGAFEY